MSSNTIRSRQLWSINNENPVKNIKNNLITNRKQNALKVLTNMIQSAKKSDLKNFKPLNVKPMKTFDTVTKCKSPLQNTAFNQHKKFNHVGCITQENDFLPSNMTCNIGMLSDFFSSKNDDKNDFFLDTYNDGMINKIQNTFETFGEESDVEHCLPPLPVLDFDFSEILNF